MTLDEMRARVDAFFTAKLREHGPTPRGVDWNSAEQQRLRFDQLLRVVDDPAAAFSLIDYGCGYGPLAGHVGRLGLRADYVGYDLSAAMVDQARRSYPGRAFTAADADLRPADYVVASGLFNVKQDASTADWQRLVERTVDRLDELAVRGFAFNLLTSYADADRQRPDLYYADPLGWFDRCKRRYARRVALLHDYYPWDFTLVVRKEPGAGRPPSDGVP